jgi:metallo-beta-lactamase class B
MKTFIIISLTVFLTSISLAQNAGTGLTISHITGDLYVYTTYNVSGAVTTPSNSMYLVTDSHVVLFDTPWDETQFQPLLDSIEKRYHKPVIACIVTHYHADRTAGIEFYREKGISTWSSALTYKLSGQKNLNQAEFYFSSDTVFKIDNYSFETYYPGPGHTEDNIVIWFPEDKVLYGGCLVKSTDYKTLGYSPDSNIDTWAASVRNVIKKYPDVQIVIPGHFNWNNKNSLQHTIKLVNRKKRE